MSNKIYICISRVQNLNVLFWEFAWQNICNRTQQVCRVLQQTNNFECDRQKYLHFREDFSVNMFFQSGYANVSVWQYVSAKKAQECLRRLIGRHRRPHRSASLWQIISDQNFVRTHSHSRKQKHKTGSLVQRFIQAHASQKHWQHLLCFQGKEFFELWQNRWNMKLVFWKSNSLDIHNRARQMRHVSAT